MRFKLRHMEAFRAVMISGSINGAARLLHTSQPGLSKTIAHLEQSLGLVLFNRTKSALIATKEAHILFAEISKLYDSVVQIDELAEQLKTGQTGRLSIATSPSFALTLVPEALRRFRVRRPDAQILCRSITVNDAGLEILGKRSELVISTIPISHPNLTCTELFASEVVCLIPRGHPLERLQVIEPAQAAAHPMISYDRDTLFGKVVRDAFAQHGLTVNSSINVVRTEQACACVQAGLGISLVSEFSIGPGLWDNIVVRPMRPSISMPVTSIHSAFEQLSSQAAEFLEILRVVASDFQSDDLRRHRGLTRLNALA